MVGNPAVPRVGLTFTLLVNTLLVPVFFLSSMVLPAKASAQGSPPASIKVVLSLVAEAAEPSFPSSRPPASRVAWLRWWRKMPVADDIAAQQVAKATIDLNMIRSASNRGEEGQQ